MSQDCLTQGNDYNLMRIISAQLRAVYRHMKEKLLCILHYSPPVHGASKIGDIIRDSEVLKDNYNCDFIKIKSSNTISDIGSFDIGKIFYLIQLLFRITIRLIVFNPEKIYFTASGSGFAFYRDVLLSVLWKIYKFVYPKTEVYYHYHTKGVNEFVSSGRIKLILTKFFVSNINIILLSPRLTRDFDKIKSFKTIQYLPNGIEDSFEKESFDKYLENKSNSSNDTINVLFLSNMIKSKGYFDVLKLAKNNLGKNIKFHFAGTWQREDEKVEFDKYIEDNNLDNIVFHGFVSGTGKIDLWKSTDLLIFPTKYKAEAFPLVALEALSYGIPVIASDEGSLSSIIDDKSGYIVEDLDNLTIYFDKGIDNLINKETSEYCRQRYLNNYTVCEFESNLVDIFRN